MAQDIYIIARTLQQPGYTSTPDGRKMHNEMVEQSQDEPYDDSYDDAIINLTCTSCGLQDCDCEYTQNFLDF